MGGWFSSSSPTPKPEPAPEPERVFTNYEYPRQSNSYPSASATPPKLTNTATNSSSYYVRWDPKEKSWKYPESYASASQRHAAPPQKPPLVVRKTRDNYLLSDSKRVPNLKYKLLSILDSSEASIDHDSPSKETLFTDSLNFLTVAKSFMQTTVKYNIVKIEEVFNPYLRLFFILRAMQYEILNGYDTEKILWFHGTKRENIDSIIFNNFNWRLHGKARGNIFGKGVSFSPISDYAANYCDENKTKVMILAESMYNHLSVGDKNMKIPPYFNSTRKIRYDTSAKPDGKVCVKYYDDEFYPRYIIHFVNKYVN